MWRDLLQGLRQLRRQPGFALAAVTILGLGIAAATAIFSIAYGVLLRELPYGQPDRLVRSSLLCRARDYRRRTQARPTISIGAAINRSSKIWPCWPPAVTST